MPRVVPDDPALTAPDPNAGVVQWALAREGFYSAWNITRGDGALVGVIDTGVDASHPDLRRRSPPASTSRIPRFDRTGGHGRGGSRHPRRVAGLRGHRQRHRYGRRRLRLQAGGREERFQRLEHRRRDRRRCRPPRPSAQYELRSRHVGAPPAPESEVRALDYARGHKVVLVAAAADTPQTEQGDPANVLQPAGTRTQSAPGASGSTSPPRDYSGARAGFAGYGGSEISLAAFGALDPGAISVLRARSRAGHLRCVSRATRRRSSSFPTPCGCRTTFAGSNHYAYLQGTSMAAPQVAATAAMMRALNPFASLGDISAHHQADRAAAPRERLEPRIWAGGSLTPARRSTPSGGSIACRRSRGCSPPGSLATGRFMLSWSGHDQQWPG